MLRLALDLTLWGLHLGATQPSRAVTVGVTVDALAAVTVIRASDARAAGVRCVRGRTLPLAWREPEVIARVGLAWVKTRDLAPRPLLVAVVGDDVLDAWCARAVTGDDGLFAAVVRSTLEARARRSPSWRRGRRSTRRPSRCRRGTT